MKAFRVLSVTLAFLLMFSCAFAAKGRLNKVFDREFSVNESTKLFIQNKYGQVNVENWDKNTISIHVEVKVDKPDDEKAKIMLDAIDVEFSESDNVVSAITKFNEDLMKSHKRLFSSISNDEMSIDYMIKMPKNIEVELNNKYGDIFINELSGKVIVNLKYGNIRVNKLERGDAENLNTLVIGYGNANLGDVNWLKVEIKYGNLKIDQARAIVLLSKYSKINVDKVNSVVVDSKYDNYVLGPISNIIGESGYTTFNIAGLSKKLNLTCKYGDVKIKSVADNFESIVFNGAYTGLKAGVSNNASYNIDAEVAYGDVKINDTKGKVSRIEGNTSTEINGVIGAESATSKIYVRSKYGNVTLMKTNSEE
ncbi:hypothetical protein CYCD_28990 [Tenuifilaceae bacterium CYCD]|nr:hypothetical protein CYCD_28990 [Tenuifilaceae bacterium CYCD]